MFKNIKSIYLSKLSKCWFESELLLLIKLSLIKKKGGVLSSFLALIERC